jgi:alkylated DNA repair dioxygenase AlkB
MQPNTFRARLAHCRPGSWGRSPEDVIQKLEHLLSADLDEEQRKRVMKRKRELSSHSTPLGDRLEYVPNCVQATPRETTDMIEFMRNQVAFTPNPRNPATNLHRKQCTFVLPGIAHYEFGQYNQHFVSDSKEWPPLVRRVFEEIRSRCVDPDLYTGVHVNLYENGGVGVNPHSDKESSMVKGFPIYSITFLDDPLTPRNFSIYHRDKTKICDIPLGHGDLVVMKAMQDDYLHGVEKHRPFKAFRPRLNFTVRAFRAF